MTTHVRSYISHSLGLRSAVALTVGQSRSRCGRGRPTLLCSANTAMYRPGLSGGPKRRSPEKPKRDDTVKTANKTFLQLVRLEKDSSSAPLRSGLRRPAPHARGRRLGAGGHTAPTGGAGRGRRGPGCSGAASPASASASGTPLGRAPERGLGRNARERTCPRRRRERVSEGRPSGARGSWGGARRGPPPRGSGRGRGYGETEGWERQPGLAAPRARGRLLHSPGGALLRASPQHLPGWGQNRPEPASAPPRPARRPAASPAVPAPGRAGLGLWEGPPCFRAGRQGAHSPDGFAKTQGFGACLSPSSV